MIKKEREKYREKLLEKKKEIIQKLSDFYSESKELETGIAQDLVDRAESSYTKEFLLSLSDSERQQLMFIDEAIKRIDSDDFGVCQRCRKEISKKRLDVIPWASLCITCQQRAEEESF